MDLVVAAEGRARRPGRAPRCARIWWSPSQTVPDAGAATVAAAADTTKVPDIAALAATPCACAAAIRPRSASASRRCGDGRTLGRLRRRRHWAIAACATQNAATTSTEPRAEVGIGTVIAGAADARSARRPVEGGAAQEAGRHLRGAASLLVRLEQLIEPGVAEHDLRIAVADHDPRRRERRRGGCCDGFDAASDRTRALLLRQLRGGRTADRRCRPVPADGRRGRQRRRTGHQLPAEHRFVGCFDARSTAGWRRGERRHRRATGSAARRCWKPRQERRGVAARRSARPSAARRRPGDRRARSRATRRRVADAARSTLRELVVRAD